MVKRQKNKASAGTGIGIGIGIGVGICIGINIGWYYKCLKHISLLTAVHHSASVLVLQLLL